MKKTIILIGLLVAGLSLQAQGPAAYVKAMTKGLDDMNKAQSIEEIQAVASHFERIAAKVTDQWQPFYYAGLNYINISMQAQGIETKDQYTAKAQTFIDKAIELAPENSEVVALQGFNYMAQLIADANTRGQTLSGKTMQQFGLAQKLDPNNPRATALLAQMQFGMAQFFGSPTEGPCNMAKKTIPIFEAEERGEDFNPTWGKGMAESLVQQCGN